MSNKFNKGDKIIIKSHPCDKKVIGRIGEINSFAWHTLDNDQYTYSVQKDLKMTKALCFFLLFAMLSCTSQTNTPPKPKPRYFISDLTLLTCVADYEFVIYRGDIFQIIDNEGHGILCKSEEQQ